MKFLLVILTAALLGTGCTSGQGKSINHTAIYPLTAEDFLAKLNQEKNALVVDVRTAEEFTKNKITRAVNYDWNNGDFKNAATGWDKQSPVFVYCLSGGRSIKAAAYLRENGFTNIYELEGGLLTLNNKNVPKTDADANQSGLTMAQYQQLLKKNKLVLVDFYAEWCGPCKKLEPHLASLAKKYKDQVEVIRIDVDKNPQLAAALQINAIPDLRLYKNQTTAWQGKGYMNERQLEKLVKEKL